MFQVYAPNRQFSKRDPDEVAFFVFHGARPPNAEEAHGAAHRVAERVPRRRRVSRQATRDKSKGSETYKVPGEKIVYAHVSDATVMMYRIPAFDAYVPDQHEVLQRM